MTYDPERFTHDADRAALKALKAIPGFSALVKGFMNIWNEPQQKILNMSTRIRLGENQMKRYYDMLPPICEKLGITIPELYLELDVVPNAYTSGDTHPFIVLTSGLLETIPDELIPTVLAHECGHIACHHVLYSTMGSFILSGASAMINRFLPLGNLLTVPLEIAFYYWMRCSEFSADRAAVLCDGTAEKQQEVCMRLAGWDKDIIADGNMEAFLQQAESYIDMINGNTWNKTLEFLILQGRTHPLMALRATECGKWAKCDEFNRIVNNLPPLEKKKNLLKPAKTDVQASLQTCRIKDTQLSVMLPKEYNKVRSMPDDPPKSISYGLETEGSQVLLTVSSKARDQLMNFDNTQVVIDGIHDALKNDQGLIEVNSGETRTGRKYIYSIVKTVVPDSGVQYCLIMDICYDEYVVTLKGFFSEHGITGVRDTTVFDFMSKQNRIILTENGVTGWNCDPYDSSYTKGIPMNCSENAEYDELFPFHPLSETRRFIRSVLENN